MFIQHLAEAVERAPAHALDAVAQTVWKGLAAGTINEAEAEAISGLIDARRAAGRLSATKSKNARQRASLRDPARVQRRRRLAASAPLPPALACQFTTGELAALRIIGDECRDRGACDRTLGEIAARAGVGRTTVQNALRQAARLGLLTVTERRRRGQASLSNVVQITSREWRAWVDRGPKGRVQKNRLQGQDYKNTGRFPGIEPGCKDLQSSAGPSFKRRNAAV